MKTQYTSLTIPKLILILCGTIATTAVFGQTTYTWIGPAIGGNLAASTNWSPTGGPPSGANQDTGQWDNQVPGNLVIDYTSAGGLPSTGFGTEGIFLVLTSNQVGSVDITCPSGSSGNLAIFSIDIATNAGAFSLGDTSLNALNVISRPGNSGQIQDYVNDSTNPAIIYPNVRWQSGGGVVHIQDFDGSGTWIVSNYLINANSAGQQVQKDGSGTMIWSGANVPLSVGNSTINSPVLINSGTVVLKTSDLLNVQTIENYGTLQYDAGGSPAGNLSGVISGSGPLIVSSGTVTLSGQNIFTNNIVLTGSGTVIVGIAETVGVSGPLGFSNTISLEGGTLQFSVNNTFDYSSRFDTSADQAYNINTGGQLVTLASGLGSSGATLTKSGSGTLTLSGSCTYSGATAVTAGKLVFQGPMSGSGNVSVADSAALGVTENGTPLAPGTLSVGTSAGGILEFNNVTNTATAPIAAGTVSAVGPVTINVNSGAFKIGSSFPLLSWTSGSAPAVSLGTLNGALGNLSTNGDTIELTVTSVALEWTGANNGDWDMTSTGNWTSAGQPATYSNPTPVVFDDTATETSVTVNALVQPKSVSVNDNSLPYSINSSSGKDIGGAAALSKSGTSTLTLSGGANAYTGVTTINGGVVRVTVLAIGGSASDIGAANNSAGNLLFNGGTLQYTGNGASIDRLFTLGTSGGTIDSSGSGALQLTNTGSVGMSGTGSRVFTLTGTDTDTNTLAAVLSDNGGPTSLAMIGTGLWALTGNNTYSGETLIASGTLQVGTGGVTGSLGKGLVTDNGSLVFSSSGTNSTAAISGSGSVTQEGSGTVVLTGNNSYSGGTTINAGTLQVGNGGTTGSLALGGNIANNGALIFNTKGGPFSIVGVISGTGTLEQSGSGLLLLIAANTYTGNTIIDKGTTLEAGKGNQGAFNCNFIDNGELLVIRQDNGVEILNGNISGTGSFVKDNNNPQNGDVTLTGTNTYTGGTTIYGGWIILGDDSTPGAGSIIGNVFMTNVSPGAGPSQSALIFNRPDDYVFSGVISGAGSVTQEGSGTLELAGANTYNGGTMISAGTLQVDTGGLIGAYEVTNDSALVFDDSQAVTVPGAISGTGTVLQEGFGTVTLTSTNNTCTGATTISNGTLVVSSTGGDLDMFGGELAPGALGSVGMLTVAGNLNISNGTVLVSLNKALSPSNSFVSVAGTITASGGALKLLNLGPAVVAGDQFAIFSEPVSGGAAMKIISPGFSVTNNLTTNGSVTVTALAPPGTELITAKIVSGQLNLAWPAIYTGLHLQSQTNSVGITTKWVTMPGTDTANSYSAALATNACVFYRLAP